MYVYLDEVGRSREDDCRNQDRKREHASKRGRGDVRVIDLLAVFALVAGEADAADVFSRLVANTTTKITQDDAIILIEILRKLLLLRLTVHYTTSLPAGI